MLLCLWINLLTKNMGYAIMLYYVNAQCIGVRYLKTLTGRVFLFGQQSSQPSRKIGGRRTMSEQITQEVKDQATTTENADTAQEGQQYPMVDIEYVGREQGDVKEEMFLSAGVELPCVILDADGKPTGKTENKAVVVRIDRQFEDDAFAGIEESSGKGGRLYVRRQGRSFDISVPADVPEMNEHVILGTSGIPMAHKAMQARGGKPARPEQVGKAYIPLTPMASTSCMEGEYHLYTAVQRVGFDNNYHLVTVRRKMGNIFDMDIIVQKCHHHVGLRFEEVPVEGRSKPRRKFVGFSYQNRPGEQRLISAQKGIKAEAAVVILGQDPESIADDHAREAAQRRMRAVIYRLGEIIGASEDAARTAGAKNPPRQKFGVSMEDMKAAMQKAVV